MEKRLLGFVMLFLVAGFAAFGQQSVSGRVTSSVDGAPLPGVSVLVKGTNSGTSTDADGRFTIGVPDNNSILVMSFIGFTTQEIPVGTQTNINVQMREDTQELSEVVVTALGIEREKKSLTYSVQEVDANRLTKARELNVLNSLSGKIAGVQINRAGSGVGAPTRVILRGDRSISGDSQPLYIVDGVPISGDISTINPDDIESISVLKGANAAALYGSRANNGVIQVTTRKGSNTGRGFSVDLNTTYMMDAPILLTNYQNEFGQGNAGTYSAASEYSWGPRMTGETVAHWSPDPNRPEATYAFSPQPNNVKDFFQTGHNFATSLGITAGNEFNQTYFSYTYTDAAGVVPGNELIRHNVNVRFTNKINNKLTLDTKINYIREEIDNLMAQGEDFSNPMRHIYRMPRNIRTSDIERYQFRNAENQVRQNYWNVGSNGGANPYWTINNNLRENSSDRVIAFTSLRYMFTPNFSIMARSAVDRVFGASSSTFFGDTYIIAQSGRFAQGRSDRMEWNSDFLLTYDKTLNDNFSFNINAGGNARKSRSSALDANTGTALTLPNFFALGNTQQVVSVYDVGVSGAVAGPKDVNSLYGFAQVSYKNALFFDITARNDWSSTLPPDAWSYFYPSFGVNGVISELWQLPAVISFLKLRASYAEVGNDTSPYNVDRLATFAAGGKRGYITINNQLPNQELKPERTKSIELGADMRFLDNRLGVDFSWYKTNSLDQLFAINLPVGSGAASEFINGGDVQNKGIELTLTGTPVMAGDFRWDVMVNYSRNRSLVKELHSKLKRLNLGSDFLRAFYIEEGHPWGEIYSRGLARNANGDVLVDVNGVPKITTGLDTRVANFQPKWLGGINNTLSYKNLSLSFLIDIRYGGTMASLTNAIIYADGVTEETLQGREGGLIVGQNILEDETVLREIPNDPADPSKGFTYEPNDVGIRAEQFWVKVGGRNAPAGEMFVANATNARMREAILSFRLPTGVVERTPFRTVSVSFVGRNLFFLSNKAKNLDADVFVGTGRTAPGFDSFGPPPSRSYGFNLNLGL